jgi:hypothetical protein
MLTRRNFIGSTMGTGAVLASGMQPALPQPTRKRMVVDAQVHLWKANSPDYPWNTGAQPQLPEPFTIERALPLMDEAGVDRVVIVPPRRCSPQNSAPVLVDRHTGASLRGRQVRRLQALSRGSRRAALPCSIASISAADRSSLRSSVF